MNGKWLLSSLFVLALLLVTGVAEAGKRDRGFSGCDGCGSFSAPPSSSRYGRWEEVPSPYSSRRSSRYYGSPSSSGWHHVGGGVYSSGWYPCDSCGPSGPVYSGYPHHSGPIYSAPAQQQLAPAPAPAPAPAAGQQFAPAPAPAPAPKQ